MSNSACHPPVTNSFSFPNWINLIIFGEKDKQTPIYMAKNLHKKISDSELHILKNCGHFCFVEEDRKVLNIVKDSV